MELGLRRWVRDQTGIELGYVEQLYTFGDRHRDPRRADRRPAGDLGRLPRPGAGGAPVGNRRGLARRLPVLPLGGLARGPAGVLDERIVPVLERWVEAAESPGRAPAPAGAERDRLRPGRRRLGRRAGARPLRAALRDRPGGRGLARPRASWARRPGAPEAAPRAAARAEPRHRARAGPCCSTTGASWPPPWAGCAARSATARWSSSCCRPPSPCSSSSAPSRPWPACRLHKGNFRRLVEKGGLVEGTGRHDTTTGGRPAEIFRFRREVLRERPAPGVGLPGLRV